jgi:hypothetical protein
MLGTLERPFEAAMPAFLPASARVKLQPEGAVIFPLEVNSAPKTAVSKTFARSAK